MVSVIVPVYQAFKTIETCVESILAQTEKDLELILVDDGSTDGSGEVCERLARTDRRIRILHEKNGGAVSARNKGKDAAKGEWITFVDSDDVIAPDYLKKLLKTAYDTGSDIAACAYIRCTRAEAGDRESLFEAGRSKKPRIEVYQGLMGTKALLYQKGFISAPWGMISRRSLWNKVSFPEGTAAEDMGTIYRLFLEASCISRTDEPLYGYVQSADNTVYSTSSKRNPDYFRHSRSMLSYIKKNEPECLKAAASRHLSTCFQILSETSPDVKDSGTKRLTERIYSDIRAVRSVVIKDQEARMRNRAAAAMSYISIKAIHRALYKRYLRSIARRETGSVTLAEYQGRRDETGRAVGHAPKVLAEYYTMTEGEHQISIYAPPCIIREIPEEIRRDKRIVALSHEILMKGHPSVKDRILNKFRMFANIHHVLHHSDADVLWFFNVEFYLFLYLALFGNAGRRIVVTLFLDGYHTGVLAGLKQRIFEAGQRRVYKCISTGPSFRFKNMPSVFIPDYVCDDSRYSPFRGNAKEGYAVCLGTMDHGKQLEELVEAFSHMSYRLVIAGRFYDKARVESLRQRATENIEIRDEYLTEDEYLKLLSGAVYAVLPYNEGKYSSQTSGVMQEAIFTDTVVLTHKDILKGNMVPGVGYGDYGDITDSLLETVPGDENDQRNRGILEEYERLRKGIYSRDNIVRKINNSLSV